jgi:heme oxygenase
VSARAALRSGTSEAHERVDALFSRYDLTQMHGYRAFLLAQAEASLPVEAALDAGGIEKLLPDWPGRRRATLLVADLADLGVSPSAGEAPRLFEPAALLGAAYVLEGSRLGGALLKRGLPEAAPRRFLEAPQEPGAWRKLMALLDEFLYEPDIIATARCAAIDIFGLFERAGRRQLES